MQDTANLAKGARKRAANAPAKKQAAGNGKGAGELQELVYALQAMKTGDFSVRMSHQDGVVGKIAEAFNEIVAANQRMAQQLKAIEAEGPPVGFAYLVLRHGIEFHEWIAEWCERTTRAVEDEAAGDRSVA